MTRLLYDVLLFLVPFALYGLYWRIAGRKAREAPARAHPWTLLIAAGLVLVALSFVLWSLPAEETREGVYVPPHIEDGRIVPGHVEPQEATPP